ncbi:MAG: M56 family metallopeptidase, partial [Sphingomicrobium sp.]
MSWLAANLLIASLLVAAVLLLRRPVAKWFGARAAYALWLAPALRLVLPPLPQPGRPTASAGSEAVNWVLETGQQATQAASHLPSLWLVWAIGAGVVLAVRLYAHHRFLDAALTAGRRYESPAIGIDIVATPAIDGPVATGLIHPLILVPQDFDRRFTTEQQHFALWHEQLHHRRGDLWAAAAALVVSSALWFNPLAWLALGAFRRDMESACDAALLASAGRDAAPAYAETILRCAARPVPRSLCALTSIDELKGRLKMLNAKHGMIAKLTGLALAGGLVVSGIVAAPAAADEPKVTHKEIRTVIVDSSEPTQLKADG